MTFEGKADWFWSETSYIELIALYVHPKNSIHRLHSRARMALDHSRLDLENKFLENKSGRIFCFRQVYFTKSCQQIWGCVNQPFNAFYTPHLRWNSTFNHTDLGQNAVFHNFSRQIALSQYSGRSIMFSETVQKISKIPYAASRFSLLTSAKFAVNINRVTLQHNKELFFFSI